MSYRYRLWDRVPHRGWKLWVDLQSQTWRALTQATINSDEAIITNSIAHLFTLPSHHLRYHGGGHPHSNKSVQRLLKQLRPDATDDREVKTKAPSASIEDRRARRANELIQEGNVGKAARVLTQQPLQPMNDQTVRQLQDLHPHGPTTLPPPLPDHSPTIHVNSHSLSKTIRNMRRGAAPGPSGWTIELIRPLLDNANCLDGLTSLIELIINGKLPDAARSLMVSSYLFAGSKPTGVRPIAIGETFYKIAATYASNSLVKNQVKEAVGPLQTGVSLQGGIEKAIHALQARIELSAQRKEKLVLVKADIANGFNAIDRHHVLKELFQYPKLAPLWRLAHWAYSHPSPLLCYDRGDLFTVLSSRQGIRQGDVLSSLLFSLGIRSTFENAIEGIESTSQAYLDDFATVCSEDDAFAVIRQLETSLPRINLQLKRASTTIFWPYPEPPSDLLKARCEELKVKLMTGSVEFLGASLGLSNEPRSHFLLQQARSHSQLIGALLNPHLSNQAMMTILRQCVIPKMAFSSRTHPPRVSKDAMCYFDRLVLTVVRDKLRLPTFDKSAILQLHLPMSQNGFGLPLTSLTSHAAYLGSIALASPYINRCLHNGRLEAKVNQALIPQNATAIHTAHHVQEAILKLRALCFSIPSEEVLPPTAQAFWVNRLVVEPAKGKGLQKIISRLINLQCKLFVAHSLYDDQERLVAFFSAGGLHAHLWLSSLPTSLPLVLKDDEFRSAAAIRLGLSPESELPQSCHCGKEMTRLHYLSCSSLRRHAITRRHDGVVQTLASVAGPYVASHKIEPHNPNLEDGSRRRPDITFGLHDRKQLVTDVSIQAQMAKSYIPRVLSVKVMKSIRELQPNELLSQLETQLPASLNTRESTKLNKHGDDAKANDAEMIPFILSCSGGWSRSSLGVIKTIEEGAHISASVVDAPLRARLLREVAMQLQRGNAGIMKEGRMQTLQHMSALMLPNLVAPSSSSSPATSLSCPPPPGQPPTSQPSRRSPHKTANSRKRC